MSNSGRVLIERNRLIASLRQHVNAHVRLICGPVGSGKTTLARQYGLSGGECVAGVPVVEGMSLDQLVAEIEVAAHADAVMLDDADTLAPAVRNAFLDRIERGMDDRRYILIGRSRRALRAQSFVARGIGAVLDAASLAFDASELMALASASRVDFGPDDVTQLLHETDGWAVAIDWIVREAVRNGCPLRSAFEAWRESCGHLLLDFVEEASERDRDAFAAFSALVRDGWTEAPEQLERFEAMGFPVVRSRRSLRPYRLVSTLRNVVEEPVQTVATSATPMLIDALGRFRCRIGQQTVNFKRRRDQNVLTYVALAQGAGVAREELLAAFWPGVNRAVATQSLRTTLSRIRHAIGHIVGAANVDRYFLSDGDVRLNPEMTSVDVRRFRDHVERGYLEDAHGEHLAAKHHFSVAARLYAGRLLASEPIEPCFLEQVAGLEKRYVDMVLRLVQILRDEKDFAAARGYAALLLARPDSELRERTLRTFAAEDALFA